MTASEGKIYVFWGVPEGTERDRGPESIFEQIIAENFPNLGRETGIQIQEIERWPPKINKNCSTPWHLIVKIANSKNKEKILKAARDKRSLTYMGRNIRLTADLHRDLTGQKGLAGYIQGPKWEEPAAKNTLSSRSSFRIGEIKSFQDRQKLKEYVTTKLALQEILRGTL